MEILKINFCPRRGQTVTIGGETHPAPRRDKSVRQGRADFGPWKYCLVLDLGAYVALLVPGNGPAPRGWGEREVRAPKWYVVPPADHPGGLGRGEA